MPASGALRCAAISALVDNAQRVSAEQAWQRPDQGLPKIWLIREMFGILFCLAYLGLPPLLAAGPFRRFYQKMGAPRFYVGAFLFLVGIVTGIVAVLYRVIAGVGFRPLLTLVETCLLLGSVFFATGLLAELMAAQRAELAELRRAAEESVATQRAELAALRRAVEALFERDDAAR